MCNALKTKLTEGISENTSSDQGINADAENMIPIITVESNRSLNPRL